MASLACWQVDVQYEQGLRVGPHFFTMWPLLMAMLGFSKLAGRFGEGASQEPVFQGEKPHYASAFQVSACIILENVPLVKESHMAESRVIVSRDHIRV